MEILVGCEFSGIVRDAFIAAGHNAISCDIKAPAQPGPHYCGDVFDLLDRRWDMIILFPPCTCVCNAGNRHYAAGKPGHDDRLAAIEWTEKLWARALECSDKVILENPPGCLSSSKLGKPTQYIQPWQFGHPEQKRTGLWLHGLPILEETDNVFEEMQKLPAKYRQRIFYMGPSKNRQDIRSTTYPGIARAMVEFWG